MLADSSGHVTGAEIVRRCRELDPATVPSTVYRTLDVLEELGLVRHGHGADGREEYHIRPADDHGHLHCAGCGRQWEVADAELRPLVEQIEGTERVQRRPVAHDPRRPLRGLRLTIVRLASGCLPE